MSEPVRKQACGVQRGLSRVTTYMYTIVLSRTDVEAHFAKGRTPLIQHGTVDVTPDLSLDYALQSGCFDPGHHHLDAARLLDCGIPVMTVGVRRWLLPSGAEVYYDVRFTDADVQWHERLFKSFICNRYSMSVAIDDTMTVSWTNGKFQLYLFVAIREPAPLPGPTDNARGPSPLRHVWDKFKDGNEGNLAFHTADGTELRYPAWLVEPKCPVLAALRRTSAGSAHHGDIKCTDVCADAVRVFVESVVWDNVPAEPLMKLTLDQLHALMSFAGAYLVADEKEPGVHMPIYTQLQHAVGSEVMSKTRGMEELARIEAWVKFMSFELPQVVAALAELRALVKRK